MGKNFHSARALALEDLFEASGISLSLLAHLFILISLLLILG
jgi:hypothetical protein